jgi:hypothetical protein
VLGPGSGAPETVQRCGAHPLLNAALSERQTCKADAHCIPLSHGLLKRLLHKTCPPVNGAACGYEACMLTMSQALRLTGQPGAPDINKQLLSFTQIKSSSML